jgi:hypothetical protein
MDVINGALAVAGSRPSRVKINGSVKPAMQPTSTMQTMDCRPGILQFPQEIGGNVGRHLLQHLDYVAVFHLLRDLGHFLLIHLLENSCQALRG